MRDHYYRLIGKLCVPCTLEEMIRSAPGPQHAGLTQVGEFTVSTVFLGINHRMLLDGPPILFETMIFTDTGEPVMDFLEFQERCSTYAEAEEMHARAVAMMEGWVAKADAALAVHSGGGADSQAGPCSTEGGPSAN